MRKFSLVAFLAVLFATAGFAQTQFNPKVGLVLANFKENYDDGEFKGKIGYQIGFDLRFGDRIYFAPGAHYFVSTNEVNLISTNNPDISLGSYDVDFKGLRVPIILGLDVIEGPNWGLRGYAGPDVLFVFTDNDDLNIFGDETFKDTRWGINAGVGVDLGILTVDVSYQWGLNNLFDDDDIEVKNNNLFVSLGLLF